MMLKTDFIYSKDLGLQVFFESDWRLTHNLATLNSLSLNRVCLKDLLPSLLLFSKAKAVFLKDFVVLRMLLADFNGFL